VSQLSLISLHLSLNFIYDKYPVCLEKLPLNVKKQIENHDDKKFYAHSLNVPIWKITGSRAHAREPVNNELNQTKSNREKPRLGVL